MKDGNICNSAPKNTRTFCGSLMSFQNLDLSRKPEPETENPKTCMDPYMPESNIMTYPMNKGPQYKRPHNTIIPNIGPPKRVLSARFGSSSCSSCSRTLMVSTSNQVVDAQMGPRGSKFALILTPSLNTGTVLMNVFMMSFTNSITITTIDYCHEECVTKEKEFSFGAVMCKSGQDCQHEQFVFLIWGCRENTCFG